MKIFNIFRKAFGTSILISLFAPIVAFAIVTDQSQLVHQESRVATMAVTGSAAQEEMVTQLMVKPRFRVGDKLKAALRAHDASKLVKSSNVAMSVVREMSGNTHVIRLTQPVTLSEARAIASRLMGDSSVELAEPDRLKRASVITPTDPYYATYQWNLFAPAAANPGSINMPDAWTVTEGNSTVTVAVIDTGYRPHADFGSAILPGYDFITDVATANDGDGRDADAQDPGDWITSAENSARGGQFHGCGVSNSSWHGTHVAGIIAAQMNSIGIAGIAPNVRILPVRVLGKCGGYDSDIIDGMRWAAGLPVTNVPANPHPAKVLNMSLGGSGGGSCPATYLSAVQEIINAGSVIVVAAGNDGTSTLSPPASCANVSGVNGIIAVTANAIDGDNAYYATIGPGTTISAPGGDCGGTNYNSINPCTAGNLANYPSVYSLLNSGMTTPVASPGGDIYAAYAGTSMATPHVSAVVALMLSINSSLTPAQIESYLKSSARTFPANTICTQAANVGMCGAGLLDAYQALNAAHPSSIPPPVVTLSSSIPSPVTTGTVVSLSGSAVAGTGRSIASYAWTQQTGPSTVMITSANTSNGSFTAPSTTGTYSFMLTATDSSGQTGTATAVIVVNSSVVASQPLVTLDTTIPTTTTSGAVVTLSGSAVAGTGRSIVSYVWTQQSGPATVTIKNANTASASFTAPSTTGTYSFTLTATDSGGQTGTATTSIDISASTSVSPISSGGKGGSMDISILAILALFAIVLGLRRRFAMM